MKIVVAMQIYRGMPFFPYALKGILPYVDEIVVVYGPQREFEKQPPDGTRGQLRLIQDYTDRKALIHVIEGRWKSETEQRNKYLEFIREEGIECDWLWVVDTDEFYPKSSITAILHEAKQITGSSVRNIIYKFFNFYYDFQHYKTNPFGMLKFIQWQDDLQYHDVIPQVLDNIGDSKHQTLWNINHYGVYDACCFHYNHICHTPTFYEREILKLIGGNRRDVGNPKKPNFHLFTDGAMRIWIESNYPWLQQPPADCQVFKGEHPNIIKDKIKESS